jgi:hypothetical protein
MTRLLGTIVKYKFGFAAFLIPLGIRAIPEIIVGPYTIGWDTTAFYVPNTLDWSSGNVSPLVMLGIAPLMYMISVIQYLLLKVNPVWIFKFMGPILYGCMIWAFFRLLGKELGWSPKRSLGASVFASLYFVTLRLSWDMDRTMLGLTFILLTIPLLDDRSSSGKRWTLPLLVVLAVLSDQLTGVVILSLLVSRALLKLKERDLNEFYRTVTAGIVGSVAFFAIVISALAEKMMTLVQNQPLAPTADVVNTSLGFLAFAYLPVVPFAILGIRTVKNTSLYTWSLSCLVLASSSLVPLISIHVLSYRWSLLLDLPVMVFATAGLVKFMSYIQEQFLAIEKIHLFKWIVPGIFCILSFLYITLPAQQAFVYYTAYPAIFPTSMVQNTVPMSDMASVPQLLDWAALHMNSDTALITHWAIYGWARAYFAYPERIVNYGFSSPLDGVRQAQLDGFSTVLMIWWDNGLGWHGQPTVPEGFLRLHRVGSMAIYTYGTLPNSPN